MASFAIVHTMQSYGIEQWGDGYFSINDKGHIAIHPDQKGSGDLYELVQDLVKQGIEPPILIRFDGILHHRIERIRKSFQTSIKKFGYKGEHLLAYPIKVNPLRHVVESVVRVPGMSLEVGSKPELISVLPLNFDGLLLCNGYKDAEYISFAMMAEKLGKHPIIIIEQALELPLVLEAAKKSGMQPKIGFRIKLSQQGAGRWKSSGGVSSKFGLFVDELVEALDLLKKEGDIKWLELIHFHMGSQIPNLNAINEGLNEGIRLYEEILKEAPNLKYLDVGGGLAIDYDGTKTDTASSMNYTLQEYTDTLISHLKNTKATLITESGRAIVAEHAVYITEVIDVSSTPERKIDKKTLDSFIEGKISLRDRANAEKSSSKNHLPDIYFCNFSLFQSLPDSWAIDQLFPIMPIHRLDEKNHRNAILADLTCDSDGKIDHFIGNKKTIPLPLYHNNPLYLAIFFVGAYQEVMGGLHNLFGDTNVIHAELDSHDEWHISRVVEGDTIAEVLSYIQHHPDELKRAFFERVEIAIKQNRLTLNEAAVVKEEFKKALESYTYLVI